MALTRGMCSVGCRHLPTACGDFRTTPTSAPHPGAASRLSCNRRSLNMTHSGLNLPSPVAIQQMPHCFAASNIPVRTFA
jgi:hypothetical protein